MITNDVDERTQSVLRLVSTDENGLSTTLTKITYRIDDVLSGTQIKGNTDVTPSSAVVLITITAEENRIINAAKNSEERLVTIKGYAAATEIINTDYRYTIRNLSKIPLPSP
jgi:hypothetical protein